MENRDFNKKLNEIVKELLKNDEAYWNGDSKGII